PFPRKDLWGYLESEMGRKLDFNEKGAIIKHGPIKTWPKDQNKFIHGEHLAKAQQTHEERHKKKAAPPQSVAASSSTEEQRIEVADVKYVRIGKNDGGNMNFLGNVKRVIVILGILLVVSILYFIGGSIM
ncbi:MAG: hypothetical protein Q8L51_03170, partial [Candidatus Amesbacteria bacterium]|nr:hypothetical protein [Candidatus Amesbacteria bacterium]